MRLRDSKIAEQFGILERSKAFERDLLKIKDVAFSKSEDGVPFDMTSFLSDIPHVIIVPEYDIRADREDYWEARDQLRESVIALAENYDLHPSGDRIEDYGKHFYFVFCCGETWRKPVNPDIPT